MIVQRREGIGPPMGEAQDTTDRDPGILANSAWTAEVVVFPKLGVNDPEGSAIRGGLASLGYDQVTEVRSGRYFEVDLTASDSDAAALAVEQMCDRLLANPVIEDYRYALRRLSSESTSVDRKSEQ